MPEIKVVVTNNGGVGKTSFYIPYIITLVEICNTDALIDDEIEKNKTEADKAIQEKKLRKDRQLQSQYLQKTKKPRHYDQRNTKSLRRSEYKCARNR